MDKNQLENILHTQMPLAKSMDVQIRHADDQRMELVCPLSKNQNHLGTGFGGSLSALMILASYCRLFYLINGKGHVVLKRSETEFLKLATEDLACFALPPSKKEAEEFLNTYQKKGRARILLTSEIRLKDGSVAARMRGEFVGLTS